ncbi:hypothetical protein A2U01_0068632, partial [Trifolium medium]|nr:hypothetical protein [Trifolium medium]
KRTRLVHHVLEERAPQHRYGGQKKTHWKSRGVADPSARGSDTATTCATR